MNRIGGRMTDPIPANIRRFTSISDGRASEPNAVLLITHRLLEPEEESILTNGVLYRPKVIILGIGCNRGTSADEIEQVIQLTLEELSFSIRSVKAVCTIDLKKDEAGLLEVTS